MDSRRKMPAPRLLALAAQDLSKKYRMLNAAMVDTHFQSENAVEVFKSQ